MKAQFTFSSTIFGYVALFTAAILLFVSSGRNACPLKTSVSIFINAMEIESMFVSRDAHIFHSDGSWCDSRHVLDFPWCSSQSENSGLTRATPCHLEVDGMDCKKMVMSH